MKKRILSGLLALSMFASSLTCYALDNLSIDVSFSAQKSNEFLLLNQTHSVSSTLAESYGFDDKVDSSSDVSVLDVLVKAHEVYYGSSFTKETVGQYLNGSSWITKAFGISSDFTFAVNDYCPNDGIISDYGSYTGYSADTAVVLDGDDVAFLFNDENAMYSDFLTFFDSKQHQTQIDTPLELTLKGYNYMAYGCSPYLEENIVAIENAKLYIVDNDSTLHIIDDKVTDENGKVTLSFDTAGIYNICATANVQTTDFWGNQINAPIFMPFATIDVESTQITPLVKLGNLQDAGIGFDWNDDMLPSKLEAFINDEWVEITTEGINIAFENSPYNARILNANNEIITYTNLTVKAPVIHPIFPEFSSNLVQTINLYCVEISAENKDWVANKDFTIDFPNYTGLYLDDICHFVVISGMYDNVKIIPSQEKKEQGYVDTVFTSHVNDNTLYANSSVVSNRIVSINAEKVEEYTVFEIPPQASLSIEEFNFYGSKIQVNPIEQIDNFVYYDLDANSTYLYTLSKSGKMSVSNVLTTGKSFYDLTDEFNEYNENSIIFSQDTQSNILLNINSSNQLDLEIDQTKQLTPLRVSQAVINSVDSLFFQPKFNYEIVVLDGDNPIEISLDGKITAKEKGTALVLVTYDSLNAFDENFSSIHQENTGAFIVCVAQDGNVETGIDLDCEFDTLYFTQDFYEYTFTPQKDSSVLVFNINNLQENNQVIDNLDGSFTAQLTHGRNVVCVTNNGITSYHFINARAVKIDIINEQGVLLTDNITASKGETLTVSIDGLLEPAPKLVGIYNFSSGICYLGEDGNLYGRGQNTSGYGSSDFLKNGVKFEITIPSDWDKSEFNFTNGDIGLCGFGLDLSAHRRIIEDGISLGFGLEQNEHFGVLPDISISVDHTAQDVLVQEISLSDSDITLFPRGVNTLIATITPANATDKNIVWQSSDESIATVDDNGKVTAVSVGFAVISATASGKTATCNVTVEKTPSSGGDVSNNYVTLSIDTLEVDNNYILQPEKFTFNSSDTVWTLLQRVMIDRDITYSATGSTESIYISSINGYDEMEFGANSGWTYYVNGEFLEYSMGLHKISNGDIIEIRYTIRNDSESSTPENGTQSDSQNNAQNDSQDDGQDDSQDELFNILDVSEQDWFFNAVHFVLEQNILGFVHGNNFNPYDNMTREEFLNLLYDENAVYLAMQAGISDGLNLDQYITREQVATMLYRLESHPTSSTNLEQYTDANLVSNFAIYPMKWACENQILTGKSDTILAPLDFATRAEIATIIMRYKNI